MGPNEALRERTRSALTAAGLSIGSTPTSLRKLPGLMEGRAAPRHGIGGCYGSCLSVDVCTLLLSSFTRPHAFCMRHPVCSRARAPICVYVCACKCVCVCVAWRYCMQCDGTPAWRC